jgi:hypothetical protein
MNLIEPDRSEISGAVRTMLRTLAQDATVNQPPWEDLIESRDAVVVPMPTSEKKMNQNNEPGIQRRRRPLLPFVAAAAVAAVVGGALVAGNAGGDSESPDGELINAISPGQVDFEASAAAAVWASGIDDPVAAAGAYLQTTGVTTAADAAGGAVTLTMRETASGTAVVDWALPAGGAATGGTVYLRSSSDEAGLQDWSVVGASSETGIALESVQFDGEAVAFTVARGSALGGEIAVGAWVDGEAVSLGGQSVPVPALGGVPVGELVALAGEAGATETLELPVGADDIVTLRVVHLVEGQVQSVVQMAMALPEADPMALTGATAYVEGAVAGAGEATTGGVAGAVEGAAEAGASLPGVSIPLPDVTIPTLPPIPGLPEVTLPPVPTSLPSSPPDLQP